MEGRSQVVAMDPCPSYRAAVHEALPQTRVVADHVHRVRLANQAVTDVRRRGRKTGPVWAARRWRLRGRERLSEAQLMRMWNDPLDGDPTANTLTA